MRNDSPSPISTRNAGRHVLSCQVGRIAMNPCNPASVIDSAITLFVLPRHSRQNRPRIVPANLCSRILSDPTAWHACLLSASRTSSLQQPSLPVWVEVILLPRPGHTRAQLHIDGPRRQFMAPGTTLRRSIGSPKRASPCFESSTFVTFD